LKKKLLLVLLAFVAAVLSINMGRNVSVQAVVVPDPFDPDLWVKICEDPYQDSSPPGDIYGDLYFKQYYYGDGTYIYFRMDLCGMKEPPAVPQRAYSVFFDTIDGGDKKHSDADVCFQYEHTTAQGDKYSVYQYDGKDWVEIKQIEGDRYWTQPPNDDGDGTNPAPKGWIWWKALISDLGSITKTTVTVRYETRNSPSFNAHIIDTQIIYIPRDSISEIPLLFLIPLCLLIIVFVRYKKRKFCLSRSDGARERKEDDENTDKTLIFVSTVAATLYFVHKRRFKRID